MARNGARFTSKVHPYGEVYINPGLVFGVTADGAGGSYVHSGQGFCFNVVGDPQWVDHTLALWGQEEPAASSEQD